jgi:hypothetical protein
METMQPEDREDQEREVIKDENRETGGSHRWLWLVILLGCLVLAAAAVTASGDFVAFVVLYAVSVVVWLRIQRCHAPSVRSLVIIAFLLRLLLAVSPPLLSDDVHRYRWDGRVSVAGRNPYRFAPADRALAALRDESHARINHPESATIYPPAAEAMFALWALLGGSLLVWRVILALVDAGTTLILARHSPRAALAWATFPLSIFEIWNGHIDSVAALLSLLAVIAVGGGALARPAFLFAAAIATKIVPAAALFPLMRARRGLAIVALTSALIIASVAPFVIAGAFMRGMDDYAQRWSFNSPLYSLTLVSVEALDLAPSAKTLFTRWKDPLRLEPIAPWLYTKMYADFFARASMGIGLLAALIVLTRRVTDYTSAATHAIGLLILFSPTIHPWYWLIVIPLALHSRQTIWLVLAAASPLSYLAYDGFNLSAVMVMSYLPAALFYARRGAGASRPRVTG